MQSLYRVTIANSTGAAPNDGFIDNTRVELYRAAGSTPATLAQSTTKERANVRFDFLRQQMQLDANVYIQDIVATGATAVAEASTFVFTAVVERGDDSLFTRDEANANAPLAGTDALVRWIARSLVIGETLLREVYDPTATPTAGNANAYARTGTRNVNVTTGPAAASLTAATALITVVKL